MYENLIDVRCSDGEYSTYVATYLDDYKKLLKSKVQEYYFQDNTDKINVLTKEIDELDKSICQLLLSKAERELELDFINKAEEVKQKNEEIKRFIEELKQKDELNKWVKDDDKLRPGEYIQNGTYKFLINVYTSKDYRTNSVEYYEVYYCFSISPILDKYCRVIKRVKKEFRGNERDKMLEYIEGRKKAYAKYFTEEKPAILKEYASYIEMYGIRLEGYRVEGENNSK